MSVGGRVWDISQDLSESTPVWPGDTAFSARRSWAMGADSPVNVSQFTLSTHAGTHADAPFHYDPAGARVGALDLAPYIGPARVVDLRGPHRLVTAEMIAAALTPSVERILLRTYDAFPRNSWSADFTAISPDAVELMAAHGVRLLGVDAPSLDPQDSKTMDAHLAVRDADIRVLEGLILDQVPAGDYELIALPLKLTNLDASPVRAVLRELRG
jgi:arylformamidase